VREQKYQRRAWGKPRSGAAGLSARNELLRGAWCHTIAWYCALFFFVENLGVGFGMQGSRHAGCFPCLSSIHWRVRYRAHTGAHGQALAHASSRAIATALPLARIHVRAHTHSRNVCLCLCAPLQGGGSMWAKLPKDLVRLVACEARAWPGGVFGNAHHVTHHVKGTARMTGAIRIVGGGFALVLPA
jgi:hypothetical protein